MHSNHFPSISVAAIAAFLLVSSPVVLARESQPVREISPILVGTNLWYGDPHPKVWKMTGEGGIRLIRIGGHAYDKKLPSEAKLVEWVKQIRSIGAEPLIQVSQYQSAGKAAEVVRLFNVERKAGAPVRYWNIGNEPWLQGGRGPFSAAPPKIAAYFKSSAAAMKAVDPDIKIFGPDACALFPEIYEPLFGGKHDITGKVPGKDYYYCDGLSWHRYPQTDHEPGLAEVADFLKSIRKARELTDLVNAKHRRKGADALQWGLGEFNAKGGRQVHTFGNGQMFGSIFGNCALYGATYCTSWSMFENNGSRQGTDFSAFDGRDFTPRASYWHARLFAEHLTGVTIPAESSRKDVLVFAAHDAKKGSIGVMILNLSAETEPLPYLLKTGESARAARSGKRLVLQVPSGETRTRADVIAPRSSQFLLFKDGKLEKTTYNAADFDAGSGPSRMIVADPFES